VSRGGKSKTAESALKQALIASYGSLGRVTGLFLLRSNNVLVFTQENISCNGRLSGDTSYRRELKPFNFHDQSGGNPQWWVLLLLGICRRSGSLGSSASN